MYGVTKHSLALQAGEDIYVGPSQFYHDPTQAKAFISYPVDIYAIWDASGKQYMLNLIYDYATYVEDFGYIPIEEFIKGWTIIVPEDYASITGSDTVYLCSSGRNMESVTVDTEESFFRDEDGFYKVTVVHNDKYGNLIHDSNETLMEGDLYYIPFIHIDYLYKSPKKKGQEGDVLCPILITGTKKQ